MPLNRSKRRLEELATSDDVTPSSSSMIATPSPDKAKRARRIGLRYSIPTNSPSNIFSDVNTRSEFTAKLNSVPMLKPHDDVARILPEKTTSFLELRIQLLRFKVFRIVHVPTTYTFEHLHSLVTFLFGWSSHHAHEFRVVRDAVVSKAKQTEGEIKSMKEWIEVVSKSKRTAGIHSDIDLDREDLRRENEEDLTIGQTWISNSRGFNIKRAVTYQYNEWDTPRHLHVTARKLLMKVSPSNLPDVIRGSGAPPVEDLGPPSPSENVENDDAENKLFDKDQFNGDAFEKYLRGELVVDLDEKEIVVCTPAKSVRRVIGSSNHRRVVEPPPDPPTPEPLPQRRKVLGEIAAADDQFEDSDEEYEILIAQAAELIADAAADDDEEEYE